MRRITWLIALVLATGVLTAAGCGGDDDNGGSSSSSGGTGTQSSGSSSTSSSSTGSGGGGQTLSVTADPGGAISWDKSKLSAKAGKVTLRIVNKSEIPHAIEVEGNGVEEETKTVTGGSAKVTVDLKPGTYEYYCPVGQHKQTMKGTLTVQ